MPLGVVPLHFVTDMFAALLAVATILAFAHWRPVPVPIGRKGYGQSLALGAILGSYVFGTANLYLTTGNFAEIGRSVLGALTGAIVAIEVYKARRRIKGSTGLIFVPAFAVLIVVGRFGCALSGLEDHTFGTPTTWPWGADYGEGFLRHPVALYEAISMALFLAYSIFALRRRNSSFMQDGFYQMVAFYAVQRFVWEFFKPYYHLIGPLNLFHLICLALMLYAWRMSGARNAA